MEKVKPDEYMALLVERAREHDEVVAARRAEQGLPPLKAWVRTLPSDMMRDSDEDFLDHEAFEAAIRRSEAEKPRMTEKATRRYLPASYWASRLETAEARLNRLLASTEPVTDDMAAYGGAVSQRLVRQRGDVGAKASAVVEQQRRVERLRGKFKDAQRREGSA